MGIRCLRTKTNNALRQTTILLKFCWSISNGNRTEWGTIQGVIGRLISNQPRATRLADLILQARLPLNCTTQSPITN